MMDDFWEALWELRFYQRHGYPSRSRRAQLELEAAFIDHVLTHATPETNLQSVDILIALLHDGIREERRSQQARLRIERARRVIVACYDQILALQKIGPETLRTLDDVILEQLRSASAKVGLRTNDGRTMDPVPTLEDLAGSVGLAMLLVAHEYLQPHALPAPLEPTHCLLFLHEENRLNRPGPPYAVATARSGRQCSLSMTGPGSCRPSTSEEQRTYIIPPAAKSAGFEIILNEPPSSAATVTAQKRSRRRHRSPTKSGSDLHEYLSSMLTVKAQQRPRPNQLPKLNTNITEKRPHSELKRKIFQRSLNVRNVLYDFSKKRKHASVHQGSTRCGREADLCPRQHKYCRTSASDEQTLADGSNPDPWKYRESQAHRVFSDCSSDTPVELCSGSTNRVQFSSTKTTPVDDIPGAIIDSELYREADDDRKPNYSARKLSWTESSGVGSVDDVEIFITDDNEVNSSDYGTEQFSWAKSLSLDIPTEEDQNSVSSSDFLPSPWRQDDHIEDCLELPTSTTSVNRRLSFPQIQTHPASELSGSSIGTIPFVSFPWYSQRLSGGIQGGPGRSGEHISEHCRTPLHPHDLLFPEKAATRRPHEKHYDTTRLPQWATDIRLPSAFEEDTYQNLVFAAIASLKLTSPVRESYFESAEYLAIAHANKERAINENPLYERIMRRHEEEMQQNAMETFLPPDTHRRPTNPFSPLHDECDETAPNDIEEDREDDESGYGHLRGGRTLKISKRFRIPLHRVLPLDIKFSDWFLNSRGNEYFCDIDEDYLTDRFNLTSLNTEVQYYQYALDLITDVLDIEVDDDTREQIEKSARHLYGLVHARYVVTTRGLQKMCEKYKNGDFGKCPRVACDGQPLLPMGQHDSANVSAVKLYCARCEDLYNPKSSRHASIDGAYFGSSFHNMFFQVYPNLMPPKSQRRYEPKIFGFRVHGPATLARWQSLKRDEMKETLRSEGLETGFEEEEREDEMEGSEDEDDVGPDGIDDMFEGRRAAY